MIKLFFLLVCDLFFFLLSCFIFLIYISFYSWAPFYDPDGMQFLLVFITSPLLLLFGFLSVMIGRIKYGATTFFSGLFFAISIILDGSLSGFPFYAGQAISFLLFILSIYFLFKDAVNIVSFVYGEHFRSHGT